VTETPFSFEEDEKPYFEEDRAPAQGLANPKLGEPSFDDRTRRWIALILVGLLAVVTLAALVSFIVNWLDVSELKELGILITPVLTLTGTAVGFYFGANKQ